MIRVADQNDVDSLVALASAMHRESNFAPLSFDDAHCASFMRTVIDADDGFACVAENDGEVVGAMMAFACPVWFGNGTEKIANDIGLYVKPAYRRGAAAIELVGAFMKWTRLKGYAQVRVGTAAGDAGQGANAIYEHYGFSRAGACFVYTPAGGQHHAYQTFDHHLAAH